MSRTIVLAACAWAAFAGAGHAQTPGGTVSTAPAGNGAPEADANVASTTDVTTGQISGWIHQNDDGSFDEGGSALPPLRRTIHGEVGVGFGSRGYSSEYGVADIPIGDTGDLIVAASNSQGHSRGGYGGRSQSLAVGLYLGGATPSAPSCAASRAYGVGGYGSPGYAVPAYGASGYGEPGYGGYGNGGCRAAPANADPQPGE